MPKWVHPTWPKYMRNWGAVSGSFKTTQKLSLLKIYLKKDFFFNYLSLSVKTLSMIILSLKNQREIFWLFSSWKPQREEICFLLSLRNKRVEYNSSKKTKGPLLKLFLVFSMKWRSRLLCCEKRMVLVIPFMTRGNKFG